LNAIASQARFERRFVATAFWADAPMASRDIAMAASFDGASCLDALAMGCKSWSDKCRCDKTP
jgi:hypothetical protein